MIQYFIYSINFCPSKLNSINYVMMIAFLDTLRYFATQSGNICNIILYFNNDLLFLPFSFQIFHTIAIILLIISTLILSIGVIQQTISYSQTIFKYDLNFVIVTIFVSVSALLFLISNIDIEINRWYPKSRIA